MRVLMLESHPGVASDAVAELTRAGHTIERCSTPDRRFPCRGIAGAGDCPLDGHVDVALMARDPGDSHLEYGAICAARSRVPVVALSAAAWDGPEIPWSTVTDEHVTEACERAASDGGAHAAVVAARLVALGVVAAAELAAPLPDVAFAVDRRGPRLQMTVTLTEPVRGREDEIVRVGAQALRDYDRQAAVIDVVVRGAGVAPLVSR